jgi:hypothetical protein
MDWTGCEFVERVPGRMNGVPVVVGSRVTPECCRACGRWIQRWTDRLNVQPAAGQSTQGD